MSSAKSVADKKVVKCRNCSGDHWASKCPQKYVDLDGGKPPDVDKNSSTNASTIGDVDKAAGTSKCLPPHMGKNSAGKRPDNASVPGQRDINSIRISNLSKSTTQTDLEELAKPFGPIKKRYLAYDKQTGQCKGFAYIHYKFRKDAVKAIAMLNEHEYNNFILNVDWSRRDGAEKRPDNASMHGQHDDTTTIHISNLSESTTETDLEELVKPFGLIQKCYLAKGEQSGQCKGLAYIHFKFHNDAAKAIAALHGREYNNFILNVDWSRRDGAEERPDNASMPGQHDDTTTIHLSNLNKSTTEIDLEELIKPFGPIQKLYLAKDKQTGQCKGFAYINFKLYNDAANAIATLNGHEYNHFILDVDWSKSPVHYNQ